MRLEDYYKNIKSRILAGDGREHTYRPDLHRYVEELVDDIQVTNDGKHIECGAPDLILRRKGVLVGSIETKDIGVNLLKTESSEQIQRYLQGQPNFIFTDYLEFRFYKDSKFVNSVQIIEKNKDEVIPIRDNWERFEQMMINFCNNVTQTIRSPTALARLMAGRAKDLKFSISESIKYDLVNNIDSKLLTQYKVLKEYIIHTLNYEEFSDLYAQTIAYGLFAARLYDDTLEDFSINEAISKIPKSNSLLRFLFRNINENNIDKGIEWSIENLVNLYLFTDIKTIISSYKKSNRKDPLQHFYEDFLKEYDKGQRVDRGVWYTPKYVVNFIIRAVDEILESEFGLNKGLANSDKIEFNDTVNGKKVKSKTHKVQILDIATGTGTFLNEVLRVIYKRFENKKGIWNSYVEKDLLRRIQGFELLMCPYTIAHLKQDLFLKETGFSSDRNIEHRIFLTNTLEDIHPDIGTLFAQEITKEAVNAFEIKEKLPIMCIVGNPPYKEDSVNNGKQFSTIQNLMNDYKSGSKNEKPLNNDYIKFIRFSENLIQKNKSGIMAMITANSFLDGIVHERMREHLLQTFDKIYVLNLWGDSNKPRNNEKGIDKNVFSIVQGVSINIFVKTSKSKKSGKVFYSNIFGSIKMKEIFLMTKKISDIEWDELNVKKPPFHFVPFNSKGLSGYEKYYSIEDIFNKNNSGITTSLDPIVVSSFEEELLIHVDDLRSLSTQEFLNKYKIDDKRNSRVERAKNDILKNEFEIIRYHHRIFEIKYAIYTGKSSGVMDRPRGSMTKNLLKKNIALIAPRQTKVKFNHAFIVDIPCDSNLIANSKKYGCGSTFPLYIYNGEKKEMNIALTFISEIERITKLTFGGDKDKTKYFNERDIFNYIYAILNSNKYKEKYNAFLQLNYPRIPILKNDLFVAMYKAGENLTNLHLMKSHLNESLSYPIAGSNLITNKINENSLMIEGETGKLMINDEQYFAGIDKELWNYTIGNYKPLQTWLDNKNGLVLNDKDIENYMQLYETIKKTIVVVDGINAKLKNIF